MPELGKDDSLEAHPTPTGKTYLELVDKYRERHPTGPVPHDALDSIWRTAAHLNDNQEMIETMNNAAVEAAQRKESAT